MKKLGIRMPLAFILVAVLLLGSFSIVSAAPKERSWVHVISIEEDNITIEYGWNKLRVYSYSVYIFESGQAAYYFQNFPLGTLTKSKEDTPVSVTAAGIDAGDQIHLRLWLFNQHGRKIKHFSIDMNVTVPAT
jgi:hypothetical protein